MLSEEDFVVKTEESESVIDVPVDTPERKCVVMATSMNLKPPSFISDTKTHEEYVKERNKCGNIKFFAEIFD